MRRVILSLAAALSCCGLYATPASALEPAASSVWAMTMQCVNSGVAFAAIKSCMLDDLDSSDGNPWRGTPAATDLLEFFDTTNARLQSGAIDDHEARLEFYTHVHDALDKFMSSDQRTALAMMTPIPEHSGAGAPAADAQLTPEERRERAIDSGSPGTTQQASAATSSVDPLVACQNRLAVDPRFAQIAKKLPLAGLDHLSFTMLADTALPTPRERKEIAELFDERDTCWRDSEAMHRTQWPPDIFALVLELNSRLKDIGVDLYNRRITYGRANKRIQDLQDSFTARLIPIVKHYQDEIAAEKKLAEERADQQRQAEADRAEQQREFAQVETEREQEAADAEAAQEQALRQQRAALFLNYMQSMQRPVVVAPLPPPPVMQSPITTNCYTYGNSTNCTSR